MDTHKFATTPPYPDDVFDTVTRKISDRMPVRYLEK